MPLDGMGGWKDVHCGTLCRNTTRRDGGRAEPPGGSQALWRSPQYDFEDAAVFCPAGLSAAGAAGVEEAWPVHCVDRHASSTAMALDGPAEAAGGRDDAEALTCGAGVLAAGESPNAFYGYFGGSGAGGQVPDCCGFGRALHRRWRYQRSAPAQARKALWPVLGGSVSTGGRGRAPGWIWPSGAQPVIRKLSLPPLGG